MEFKTSYTDASGNQWSIEYKHDRWVATDLEGNVKRDVRLSFVMELINTSANKKAKAKFVRINAIALATDQPKCFKVGEVTSRPDEVDCWVSFHTGRCKTMAKRLYAHTDANLAKLEEMHQLREQIQRIKDSLDPIAFTDAQPVVAA